MPRAKQGARVLGPFLSGERFRVVSIDASGKRTAFTFESAQEARRHLARLVKALDERTVESTVDDWTAARSRAGKVLPGTIAHQAERVRGLRLGGNLPTCDGRGVRKVRRWAVEPSASLVTYR